MNELLKWWCSGACVSWWMNPMVQIPIRKQNSPKQHIQGCQGRFFYKNFSVKKNTQFTDSSRRTQLNGRLLCIYRVFFKFYCFFLLDRFHLNLLIPFIGPSRDSAMFPKHCSNKPVELSVKMARPEGAFDREIDKQHIGKLERILNVWHIYLPHFGYS